MLWDIYGQDEFQTVRDSYLRGASGYLLVADGTRHATLETAPRLQQKRRIGRRPRPVPAAAQQGRPHPEWQVDDKALVELVEHGWSSSGRARRPATASKAHSRCWRPGWPPEAVRIKAR